MYLPREGKLVAPALHMTSHGIRSVWMPWGVDQWIDCLKASSVFYIVLIAPDVLTSSSIRFVDDTLARAVDLLDTVREGHLVRVGAVSGRRLCGSEEAWSTFGCVPVDKACAVIFVDYIAIFSTNIVNLSTNIGEISQDNLQISSPQT